MSGGWEPRHPLCSSVSRTLQDLRRSYKPYVQLLEDNALQSPNQGRHALEGACAQEPPNHTHTHTHRCARNGSRERAAPQGRGRFNTGMGTEDTRRRRAARASSPHRSGAPFSPPSPGTRGACRVPPGAPAPPLATPRPPQWRGRRRRGRRRAVAPGLGGGP